MTGQVPIGGYADTGLFVAAELVNRVAGDADLSDLREILAVDPPSLAALEARHAKGFAALAADLRAIFDACHLDDIDAAAAGLNDMLADHPARPHLAKDPDGTWRMHHHSADAELVPMWASICAEALARLIGEGGSHRIGTCERPGCGQVFIDVSKNGSRRFCSVTCQNRVKAAAFRRRRSTTIDS